MSLFSSWVFSVVYLQDFSLNVSQDVSQDVWQNQTAHQSIELFEFDLHIFALATEVTGKTIVEPEGEIEENRDDNLRENDQSERQSVLKALKKKKAASISDEVERRSAIPRGMDVSSYTMEKC